MNILIPHSWLLEHLETTASPQDIAKYLSLSGPSVERIYETLGEPVYDIEVTTNRVDSMSVRGIAREAAVILAQAGIPSKLKNLAPIPQFMKKTMGKKSGEYALPVIKNDPKLCRRIVTMLLTDAHHVSSPEWMQIRLRQIGQNVHDAIIDITNYVTHDLGHPCHAFDYDKVMKLGGTIRVVRAAKGKHFTTLDEQTYETVGGEVVFESDNGEIIDLPGIKGTANTSIDASTKNVLFWIESVDPTLIRFSSMTHAIRTVAAQLNEKNVDPYLAVPTFAKGVDLFSSLAHAAVHSETFIDIFPAQKEMPTVTLPLSRIEQYLGVVIAPTRIKEILTKLGCSASLSGKELTAIPPTRRPDIAIPEDVVEEIARIFGYHNLPSTLMTGAIPTHRPTDTDFTKEHESKLLLASLGGYEVYTYSMVSEAIAIQESLFICGTAATEKTHVKIKNPLTEDMVYMRRTLWKSHTQIAASQKQPIVFELANVYLPSLDTEGSTLPSEELHLTITSVREMRKLVAMLDALLGQLYLPPARYVVNSNTIADIFVQDIKIGQRIQLAIEQVLDLNWTTIIAMAREYPVVRPIPKVSPIIEDMTFAFPHLPYVQDVIDTIRKVNPLIARVVYKETYKQNITVTIYYQPQEEMSAQEISPYRKSVCTALHTAFGASLVGEA